MLNSCVRGLLAAAVLLVNPVSAADTLLVHGGTILTMDAAVEASSLLVKDGRIVAVGVTPAETAALIEATRQPDAGTTLLDLQGQTLLPGIVDSHAHVVELGMDALKADLVGATSVEAMVARLKARFPDASPGEWLLGQGWDEGKFASTGYPDRAALDAAFPENPVFLESLHGFAALANGQALARAGIDVGGVITADPEAGTILRREDGSATGTLLTLAQVAVREQLPEITQDQRKAAILAGLNTMARAGVTSIHEAGIDGEDVAAYQELAASGLLPIRAYLMLNGNNEPLMQQWFEQGPLEREDGMLAVRSIKVYYDGSLGSRSALLRAPYSDHPEKANPAERITPDRVQSLANRAAEKGFQIAAHGIGDEANDRLLNIYEAVLKQHPSLDHRWRIEHAQVVLPDYFARAAALGVISSMQSSHAVGDSAWAEDRLGPERIRLAYAWQTLLAAGARLAINSDLPGEPWTPAETLYFAVTRKHLDGTPADGWYADQALSVEESLAAMTLAGAHAGFQDHLLGSLTPGKVADFIIVSQDPRTLPVDDLKQLVVTATFVAGKRLPSS